MKNIDQVLNQNAAKVGHLLRRYRVIGGVNMETIERAHAQHGETFLMKLLEIITPDNSNFEALIQPHPALLVSAPLDTKTLSTAAPAQTGKFWNFLNNLLNGVAVTGQTVGQFKTDVTGANAVTPEMIQAEAAAAQTTKTLFIIAGAFIALIIIILLIKK